MPVATFTSVRTTTPDWAALLTSLRTAVNDANTGLVWNGVQYTVKKASAFTGPELSAAQNAIDAAPALTTQREAQNQIDSLPIALRALVLALIDPINLLRTQPTQAFAAVTPAQAFSAIRDKAATL